MQRPLLYYIIAVTLVSHPTPPCLVVRNQVHPFISPKSPVVQDAKGVAVTPVFTYADSRAEPFAVSTPPLSLGTPLCVCGTWMN